MRVDEESGDERAFLEMQAVDMNGWQYGNQLYKERSDDPAWLMRSSELRRAVDIRDKRAGMSLGARPVMLVDVLNTLSTALDYDTYGSLWSDWGHLAAPPRTADRRSIRLGCWREIVRYAGLTGNSRGSISGGPTRRNRARNAA